MELTEKQKRFADEYVIDFNATQAAIRAGYSEKTANEQGARLLVNVSIQNRIKEHQSRLANKMEITKERVLKEYAAIAFSDVRKIFTVDGALQQVNLLEDDIAPAVSSVEVQEMKVEDLVVGQTSKIKLWDKKGALDSICKMLGFNAPDKTELSNPDGTLKPSAPFTDSQVDKILSAIKGKK